jgi:hypothetical protein
VQVQGVKVDLTPGGLFCFAGNKMTYKVLFTVREGRTLQEQVVYEGVDGPDCGQRFCCSLNDFAVKFTAVLPDPEPAEEVLPALEVPQPAFIEKVIDHTEKGLL